jgi:hypothetical protein
MESVAGNVSAAAGVALCRTGASLLSGRLRKIAQLAWTDLA